MPGSPCSACVVFDPTLTDYDFGPAHPMSPMRVDLTVLLARELGVLAPAGGGPGLPTVTAPMADDELVATVHDPAYIDAVRLAGKDPHRVIEERGLGTADNPTFEGMHEASAHVVGATVEAARRVWTGDVLHAANISGGLHHAMPDRASGFCVYNDVAVGIRVAARPGRRAGGVRRRRRAPRRRRREGVLRRPAGAHDQPARDRPDAVPRHRVPQRHRRTGAPRAARSTSRCRPARRTPAGCARSTRSSRRWCGSSRPTCWSPSRAATRTSRTRWRT